MRISEIVAPARILYHTTERESIEAIMRDGFEPSYASLGEAVYFYGTIDSAVIFAKQRSYRTFEDPIVLAIEDNRPRKVDRADLDGIQDPRVYADVWVVYLDEDEGETTFKPSRVWIANDKPRARMR